MQLITVDFDGTLFEEDSFKLMFRTRSEEFGIREWAMIVFAVIQALLFGIFKGKQALRTHIFKTVAKTFKGKTREELDDFFHQLIIEKKDRINRKLVQTIEEHRKNGNQVMILSGALQPFLEALVRELNLDVVIIGTELYFDEDGTCTGETGPLVNGEEKVLAVTDWLKAEQMDSKNMKLWAYADSESDIPLLHFVDRPIIVNPKEKMRDVAKTNRWPIYGEN